MSKLMLAEAYKMLRNRYLHVSVLIITAVMLLCCFSEVGEKRIVNQIYFMSFIYIVVTCLTVASIVSNEYTSLTMRELIMAGQGRVRIFVVKLIAVLFASTLLFAVYGMLLYCSNSADTWLLGYPIFVSQFCALMQHVLLLYTVSIVLRSSSGLAIFSTAALVVYREFSVHSFSGFIGKILPQTFISQFSNPSFSSSTVVALIVVLCISCLVGISVFSVQEM